MIGYVTLGTNEFEKATKFYDGLLSVVDIPQLWNAGTMVAWGKSRETPALCLTRPFNGKEAVSGNGTMIALKFDRQEDIHALHAKALELGGSCEGEPGPRGTGGFYGAYFRDLDGNKLCVYMAASKME